MIIFTGKHYYYQGNRYLVHSTYNDGTCDLLGANGQYFEDVPKCQLESAV